jgi:glycosyltransferase involved in cell wall biosynthesis
MRISVCITHYNRPESLGATLASLLAQTLVPDEIFLWDDCSPKDPSAVVAEWKDRFPHFVYHRNAENRGMPGNLNDVIQQATGDYVANLHDADIYHPRLLEKWAAALDRAPDAGLVFCRDSRWDNPRFVRHWTPEPAELTGGVEFFRRHYIGRVDSIIWGTVMVRKSIYDQLLPFDPQYKNWADVDMWMRVCACAGIAFVPEQLIKLDDNPTHGGRFSFERMRHIQDMVLSNIERLFDGNRLQSALKLQSRIWRRLWIRWMFGRLRRFNLREAYRGLYSF